MNTEPNDVRANDEDRDNHKDEASLGDVLGCPAEELGSGLLLTVIVVVPEPQRSPPMTRLKTPICDERSQLIEVLAWHLLTSSATVWPGSDGLTVEDVVVADYRLEAEAGHVPLPEALILQHPNLADAIRSFFRHC